jgi:hypothetical protein
MLDRKKGIPPQERELACYERERSIHSREVSLQTRTESFDGTRDTLLRGRNSDFVSGWDGLTLQSGLTDSRPWKGHIAFAFAFPLKSPVTLRAGCTRQYHGCLPAAGVVDILK